MSAPETTDLRRLAGEYRALTASKSDADLRRAPAPSEWCALEIAGHIRDAAEIEHARVLRLLREDNPLLPGYDERAMVDAGAYRLADRAGLERDMLEAWGRLASLLDGLEGRDWSRRGRHPVRGDVTVRGRIRRYLEHAREHFEQVGRTLASTAGR